MAKPMALELNVRKKARTDEVAEMVVDMLPGGASMERHAVNEVRVFAWQWTCDTIASAIAAL